MTETPIWIGAVLLMTGLILILFAPLFLIVAVTDALPIWPVAIGVLAGMWLVWRAHQ